MSVDLKKVYIRASQMEHDCWQFSYDIYSAGNDFDLIVGVTRGGAQISIYMQEAFSVLCGHNKAYATVGARSYDGINSAGEVLVENLNSVTSKSEPGTKILIVDDIFDRGLTFKVVSDAIKAAVPRSCEVKLAALYYKPENSRVDIEPDFYYQTFSANDWVVLPHELCGLTPEELREKGFVWTMEKTPVSES